MESLFHVLLLRIETIRKLFNFATP